MKKSLLALILSIVTVLNSYAYDAKIDGIYYNFSGTEATVTSLHYGTDNSNAYSGDIIIPSTVDYKGQTYNVTSIGESAFWCCSSLTSIGIPSSVTLIDDDAFEDCTSLTSIDIPNSVTSIGIAAFSDCTSLTSIIIPNSVVSIGGGAFWGCTSLTSIAIPNSVTSIEEMTFQECASLSSVIIPNSVTSIRWRAFAGCESLLDIYSLNTTPPACDTYAFKTSLYNNFDTNTARLHVPLGTKDAYASAECWRDFKNILEENLSSIALATTDRAHTEIFNIHGVKETNKTHTLRKGFYIVDGKKVYIK